MSDQQSRPVERWITEGEEFTADARIFSMYAVRRRSPWRGHSAAFTVLRSPDWVNIIPLTADGEVVMVKQYRHGTDEITIELPGGMVERGEHPMHAGMRECVEETGWQGMADAVFLGVSEPNPAFLNNRCYSYLWTDCVYVGTQQCDPNEEIEVVTIPLAEVFAMVGRGEIRHSLVLNALLYWKIGGATNS